MINQVVLIGRLTKDCQSKKSTDSKELLVWGSIAQNYGTKGKEKTYYYDFIKSCSIDSKICDYLKKGTQVALVGTLTYKEKEKDSKKEKSYFVRVSSLELLARPEGESKPRDEASSKEVEEELPF